MSAAGWILAIIAALAIRALVRKARALKPYKIELYHRNDDIPAIMAEKQRKREKFDREFPG